VAQQFGKNTGIQFSYFVTNLGSFGDDEFTYSYEAAFQMIA
jgi:hypothetical protein